MWSRCRRCGTSKTGRNQAVHLAAPLGFEYAYGPRYAIDGIAIGNAILNLGVLADLRYWC